jgi:KaiC/GvpD/RAD55 family RecA-like ATPase
MYPDLNAFIEQPSPPKSEFVLIKDFAPTCEGSLLIHHFISLYLQTNCQVCFLAFEEDFQHYSHVSRKLSVQFQETIDSGKLVYIDGFTRPYILTEGAVESAGSAATAVSEEKLLDQSLSSHETFSIGYEEEFSSAVVRLLKKIWTSVQSFEERFKGTQSCIIIDSMSTFVNSSRSADSDGNHCMTNLA